VKLTDGFTGSEVEQTVIDALFDSFDRGHDLDTETIVDAIKRTVPLSVTMSEQINAMRQWAKNRARAAGKVRPVSYSSGRKLAA